METVKSFNYLGRVLRIGDNTWMAVVGNLQKSRKSWVRMMSILSREGAELKVLGNLFKAVVHMVLIFGAEAWVLTPRMEPELISFQHRVVRQLNMRKPRPRGEISW